MYTYDQLENGNKALHQAEEGQKKSKSELGQIKSGH